MNLSIQNKWLKVSGIFQLVNWALILIPSTLLVLFMTPQSFIARLFMLLMMGLVLIISIHSIFGKMRPPTKIIVMGFHILLFVQSLLFIGAFIYLVIFYEGFPPLSFG